MKKFLLVFQIAIIAIAFVSCNQRITTLLTDETTNTSEEQALFTVGRDHKISKYVDQIDLFPEIPSNYVYYDYLSKARELDALVFSFAENKDAIAPSYIQDQQNTWFPIGYWIDQARQPSTYDPLTTGYLKRTFGLPTYVGDTRIVSTGTESMVDIAMILGPTYAGLDKSNVSYGDEVYDFVEMTLSAYDTGTKLVTNGGVQGQSFWYDVFPQVLFARLYAEYPNTEYMRDMVLNGSDQWLEALPYFLKDGVVNFEYVGFNVVLESPTVVGDHIEPPNGGLAFLFYSAYEMTGEEKYLDGAKFVLDYFESYQKNPNYEAMTDYAPLVAAALNYKYGTSYDVGKYLDYLFYGDSSFRPGWAVMTGDFNGYSVNGLVGQASDYAFAMNSFHLASTLVPMVKYDPRFIDDIGIYMLNLVNNAKVFFPQEMPLDKQSMDIYLSQDRFGSICYEGFRNQYAGIGGYAMGDGTTMFNIPSDLSIYSASFIGFLGGIVSQTNVDGILQLDLNRTDSFGDKTFPYYAYYNPYKEAKEVVYNSDEPYDLFDVVTKTVLARNVVGESRIKIPEESSRLVIQLPANSTIIRQGSKLFVNDTLIAKYQAAINITNIGSRQELNENSIIEFSYSVPLDDSIKNMKIYFNEILVYDGSLIESFSYDKSDLPDTDYTMRVQITTSNGLTDVASKRVICR